jgi:hypothetical protein
MLGSVFGLPARALMRNKLSVRIETFGEVPVYLTKCNHDLLLGWSMVESAFHILKTNAPFWYDHLKSFNYIMTSDKGPIATFCCADRCCLVNPWKIPQYSNNLAPTYLAAYIVGTLCKAVLIEGRFGYLGDRHCQWLSLKSEIRFLRRCLTGDNYIGVLTAMSFCYELADKMRPGHNYQQSFMQNEVRQWRLKNFQT